MTLLKKRLNPSYLKFVCGIEWHFTDLIKPCPVFNDVSNRQLSKLQQGCF